ncbi:putative protein kinase [Leptomonas pyrrhocoris]|uniref:non-specific serine/threonine protein kinase n=1 Tax=Leptomonas pyrrhocoris TaxID=157538 RepID=A0A0N1J5J5_LEPPY|nr:putative protein kinase [Leptomonas pyrrhocoris]KPA86841.1 putative protein kinase [Leptomonas pyrrhocoris]|eukprot:XP_015665280.1 putative protein kinase [Leptomonas pyrrhocoris]
MQGTSVAETDSRKAAGLVMSDEHAVYGGVAGGPVYHSLPRRHPNGSVSPPPRSQSPPSTPAKQLQQLQQLHSLQQQQSLVYSPPPQTRAFSTPQSGSPNLYRVSPITCENSSEVPAFNPLSPYRSTAPSQSRFFNPSPHTSANDPTYRNVGPGVAPSSYSPFSAPSPQPPRFRRVITSPPTSVSLCGDPTTEAAQVPTTKAESGFTAVRTNTNAQHTTNIPQGTPHYRNGVASAGTPEALSPHPSKSAQSMGLSSPAPATGDGRLHFSPPNQLHQPQQQRAMGGASHSGQTTAMSRSLQMAPGAAMAGVAARRSASPNNAANSSTILPRKQPENVSPGVNSSLLGRFSASSSHPSSDGAMQLLSRAALSGIATPQRPLAQPHEPPTGSPPPPPHASVVVAVIPSPPRDAAALPDLPSHSGAAGGGSGGARSGEMAGRWISPQRPHRTASTDSSDRFYSPGSAPSSCGTSSSAPPQSSQPPLPPPQRSPAMYGVIGLPYARAEAGATAAASGVASAGARSCDGSTSAKPMVVFPTTQFHAVPSSSSSSSFSRAPAVVKRRSPPQPREEQRAGLPQRQHDTMEACNAPIDHADPAAAAMGASSDATATSSAAHPRSGSNGLSMPYHKSIVHGAPSNSSRTNNNSTHARASVGANMSHDAAHAEAAMSAAGQMTGAARLAPFSPPPPPPADGDDEREADLDEKERASLAEEQQQQHQPQHITSVAPAVVVAARTRLPVSTATVTAAVVNAVRESERRVSGTPIHAFAAGVSSRGSPQLTADTVLPVAAQEEEPRFSSSTTCTTERSNSNSRLQATTATTTATAAAAATTTTSPKSSKASMMAAPTPLSSGSAGKLSQTASDLSTCLSRQQRLSMKQLPLQQSPLSATYSGNGSPVVTRATAVSVSSDVNGQTSSDSAHFHCGSGSFNSTSSSKSPSPALSGYSFVSSRAHLQRYIDQWRDRFEEDKSAYKEGGYLTVTPGKIVHSRYVLIQKLGWGEFSTVWLAYDTKHATLGRGAKQAFVAVKVAKCRSSVQEATYYEVSLLRYIEARLPPHATVTNIIDCFDVQGEFGMHTCMVMPLCGPNLLSIIDRVKGQRGRRSADDVRLVKEIILSVLISLHELSVLNVLHTDIKPENILCCAVDTKLLGSMEKFCSYNKDRRHMISTDEFHDAMKQQTGDHLVCLADFGLSALLEPPGSAATWTALCPSVNPSLLAPLMRCKKNFNVTTSGVVENLRGTLIQTREYRAPEVLLGLDFTSATDVWSVGCTAFELITGNFLMDPKKKTRDAREMDVEHLAMMMQLIGPLPPEITDIRVRNNDYYDGIMKGTPLPRRTTRPPPEYLHRFVDQDGGFIYASRYRAYPRRSLEMELEPYLGFREARLASNFILSCLYSYDPKSRPSAQKLLGHPWLRSVGTSSMDKCALRQAPGN